MKSNLRRLKVPACNPHSHNFIDSLWGGKKLYVKSEKKKYVSSICGCIADTACRTLRLNELQHLFCLKRILAETRIIIPEYPST